MTSERSSALVQTALDETTGTAGLERIVESVADALNLATTFVSAPITGRPGWNRLVACSTDGFSGEPHEYELVGTPTEFVTAEPVTTFHDVQTSFPRDRWLNKLGASTFITVNIPTRRHPGPAYLGLIDTEPRSLTSDDASGLALVAMRIASELDQQHADGELALALEELDLRSTERDGALNAFHDLRFRVSADGTYLSVSTADPALLLHSADEVIGSNIADQLPPELARRLLDAIGTTLTTGEVTSIEFEREDHAHFAARVARLHDNEAIVVVRDVSETVALKEQLLHAQTLQSVGRLAGGVAHDFNNALHVIRGHASALQRHADDSGASVHRLNAIVRAVDRTASLVDRLIKISQPMTNDPTHTFIDAFIVGLAPVMREILSDSIELSFDFDAAACAVIIDDSRLENVLVNLTTNARDALPEGGQIAIQTRHIHTGLMAIEFRDTGDGMDAATKSRVFQPFFTTKEPGVGTGLGLATVYETISAAGGSIDLESLAGAGTTITIELPCVEHRSAEYAVGTGEPSPDGRSRRATP